MFLSTHCFTWNFQQRKQYSLIKKQNNNKKQLFWLRFAFRGILLYETKFFVFVSRETHQNQLSAIWAQCLKRGFFTKTLSMEYISCFTWNFLCFFLFVVLIFFIFCFWSRKIIKKSPKQLQFAPNQLKNRSNSPKSRFESFENHPKFVLDPLRITRIHPKSLKKLFNPPNHRPELLEITKKRSKIAKKVLREHQECACRTFKKRQKRTKTCRRCL